MRRSRYLKASTRDRVRAGEMLNVSRQKAADSLAAATAVREDVMDQKGLKAGGPQVNVLSFQGMDLERLKALAEGKPLSPGVVGCKALVEGEQDGTEITSATSVQASTSRAQELHPRSHPQTPVPLHVRFREGTR